MASTLPYTLFQCPCTLELPDRNSNKPGQTVHSTHHDADERNFDPRSTRAAYSLYPLEHLLYCEDCQQIRCPRCVLDEIVTWYCPNCLFEVPSSSIKTEGNRCTRSCFQCPICISPLSVTSLESPPTGLGAEYTTAGGPWVLSCPYCCWNSKEIGIQFEKPNGIYSQLAKVKNGGEAIKPPTERQEGGLLSGSVISGEYEDDDGKTGPDEELDVEAQFSNLRKFYQSQLAEISSAGPLSFSGDYGYGSPGTLSRIMGLYTGGSFNMRNAKNKKSVMREAQTASEGLSICSSEDNIVDQLKRDGWESTTSSGQRRAQPHNPRFIDDLRPIPYLLRTKRSRRCKNCRHILTKPESKVQTTRFRIRLVALNYIPSMTIKPISPPSPPAITAMAPAAASTPAPATVALTPLTTTQFLLTLKNPLFDPIKVTLATPSHTPGRFSSKVTLLCPQFDVGANTDVWDEALQGDSTQDRRRTSREAIEGQAEAGKVWERGRNWVSIVVEVVPASLSLQEGTALFQESEDGGDGTANARGDEEISEDEDILEIPVFVRVEWETEANQEEDDTAAATAATSKEKDAKEKRELAYWCVLGVGRIVQA